MDPINPDKLWTTPFATPMIEQAFAFIQDIIWSSHPGAVIFAPTGTGKSSLIRLMMDECTSFVAPDGTLLESAVFSVDANERYAMSEGGFWGWLLHQLKHEKADAHSGPQAKRFLVYQSAKDLAARSSSGRLLLFIDEAQKLGLEELGLLADLLNELALCGFRLVVFLVGSYHLEHWKNDLKSSRYSAVRRRFFSKEWPLNGLLTIDHFRRCLRRYDVDTAPFGGATTTTAFYVPEWYREGGRLESYASLFPVAFAEDVKSASPVQVPMAFFCLTLQDLLKRRAIPPTPEQLRAAVKASNFAFNYEPNAYEKDRGADPEKER